MKLGYLVAIIFLAAVMSAMSARVVQLTSDLSRTAAQAAQVHHAACAYRHGLLVDAKTTYDYAKAHPHGAPSLGLTQASLYKTAATQKKRADSLRGLICRG